VVVLDELGGDAELDETAAGIGLGKEAPLIPEALRGQDLDLGQNGGLTAPRLSARGRDPRPLSP
jgi:hypothetical protein